jgi:tRNA G26 N,N-dimethylase Trm1
VRLKKGPETEREETKQNQFEESQEFMSEDSRLTMRKDIFVSYVDIDDFFYKVFYLQKKFSLCKTVMLLVSSEDGVGNIKNLALTVLSQNPIL